MELLLRSLILVPVLFFCFSGLPAPRLNQGELCDNAIDDDQDGLIDLQDPDCQCQPVPLVPNGSFEGSDCCPEAPSQDYCLLDWEKATLSTPDLLNTCGWMGWEQFPVPLPLPDGDACIGFRNGRFESRLRPEEKEYIGLCLADKPLQPETTYRFSFFVGYTEGGHSATTELVFYGTNDCEYLPAGIDTIDMVCPGNEPGWFEMEGVSIGGSNAWVFYEFDYTPVEEIAAIAIGPECRWADAEVDLYYFFDDFAIEKKDPIPLKIRTDGPPCSSNFALEVDRREDLSYQWYRNQIALVGETRHRLAVNGQDGSYQVAVFDGSECRLTPPYVYLSSGLVTKINSTICAGETYDFMGQPLQEPGVYQATLPASDGCDSLIQLTLEVQQPVTDSLNVRLLSGETFQLGNRSYEAPGSYEVTLPREEGCDSLIFLTVEQFDIFFPNAFSPNGDRINDHFTVFGGPELAAIINLTIFDRWGSVVWQGQNLPPNDESAGWDGEAMPEGVYIFTATLEVEDGSMKNRAGQVLLIR